MMFKQLSFFSKFMFGSVAVLLVITLGLGIATAVNSNKSGKDPIVIGEDGGTSTPSPTSIADLSATPEPTAEPTRKLVIALDPGQQAAQDTDLEPVGPGASTTVEKMSYGATSVTTKEREYVWTLRMAEMVKAELEARNYSVVMLRDTNDDSFKLSNSERAQKANDAEADLLIGIQLDGASTAPTAAGMYFQIASSDNPYVTTENITASTKLAQLLHDYLITKTGANDRGIKTKDDLALINWAKMPTVVATLGFATNTDEDTLLQSADYMQKMTGAICDAIDDYFKEDAE